MRRKSVHLLTCKGCEQRTSTPHTLAPPDSGEAHLTDPFCLVHVQPNCWRPDSGAESHLSVASLLSSSFSFPVVGFLKPSRSWIHESGANLPCLAAWDGYPDIRAFSPSGVIHALGWGEGSGSRRRLPPSPSGAALGLFIRLRSLHWSLGIFVELNLSWFLWLGYNPNIPVYQALFSNLLASPLLTPTLVPAEPPKNREAREGLEEGGVPASLHHINKEVKEASVCLECQAWNAVRRSVYITRLGLSMKSFTSSNQLSLSFHDAFQDMWLSF